MDTTLSNVVVSGPYSVWFLDDSYSVALRFTLNYTLANLLLHFRPLFTIFLPSQLRFGAFFTTLWPILCYTLAHSLLHLGPFLLLIYTLTHNLFFCALALNTTLAHIFLNCILIYTSINWIRRFTSGNLLISAHIHSRITIQSKLPWSFKS